MPVYIGSNHSEENVPNGCGGKKFTVTRLGLLLELEKAEKARFVLSDAQVCSNSTALIE